MKKATAIASLLVGVFASVAQMHATAQGKCVEKSQEHSRPD
jgi:hypothetical protein